MSTRMVKEQNLEKQIQKQMGCMAGFLQIFDRHQILSGKRNYSAKRLISSPTMDAATESEKSAPPSPAISERSKQSPVAVGVAVDDLPSKSPLRLELREVTRSPWKFGKDAPRLSLDSRATTDAKGGLHPREIRTGGSIISFGAAFGGVGRCESISSDATDESQQHRSPCVIARLMGLEPPADSSTSEPETKPQLRRSASESRVSRDLFQSRVTGNKPIHSQTPFFQNVEKDELPTFARYADQNIYSVRGAHTSESPKRFNSSTPWKAPQLHHRGFFDWGDFFPETKQTGSEYGEIENRFRFRGINEPSKDLDTLKQILEALQLKGLLHSRKSPEQNQVRHRNFVYDQSPNVLMRPPRLSNSSPINRRRGNDCSSPSGRNQISGVTRSYGIVGENSPAVSPRRGRNVRSRNPSGRTSIPTATTRNESTAFGRLSNSSVKPKPLRVQTQKKNESIENRRASPVQSPKLSPKRPELGSAASSRSPRRKKSTAEILQKEKITTLVAAEDESSSTSISGCSITASTDTEKYRTDCKEGLHLLERCDKLLHSIAEMTATDMQPSPVSVLDSSFYKDESATPSPILIRRNMDFKDQSNEAEVEISSPEGTSDGSDFAYVSDILRASPRHLHGELDLFLLLEKQQHLKGKKDLSKSSMLQRKLVFDTILDILDRKRRLPPWKAVSSVNRDGSRPSIGEVWPEFERLRARGNGEDDRDLFETVCGVLRKDLAGSGLDGWDEWDVEISEVVLDIERLVFKDLITETIRDLAASQVVMLRRKLVF